MLSMAGAYGISHGVAMAAKRQPLLVERASGEERLGVLLGISRQIVVGKLLGRARGQIDARGLA